MVRWFGSRAAAPQPVGPAYDREAERLASAEILAQGQWLYEQHERRVQNAQNMAVAILTIVGTIMALAPGLIPERPACWVFLALGLLATSGVVTIVNCVRVLVPRVRRNGLPSETALRALAQQHETSTAAGITVPVTQFAVDLLNPLKPNEPSPLSEAASDAERRMDILRHVYLSFAVTFGLAILISTLITLL